MIVELTFEAERDLEGIGDYIAVDNPRRALSFVEEVRDRCLDLANAPLSHPLVPRYEARGVRRRIHGAYIIFYRVERQKVIVLHVLHGAMDYAAILFPD